jgi:hypothetical protein
MKERNFFHGEVKADLEEAGYTVFLETDKELTYTGRENRPADALAFKGNVVISIEMKTEQELSPKSPSSGDSLKYDYSAGTREKVRTMIENGEITREEGMHRVHINQAEHYAKKLKEGIWGTRKGVSIQSKKIKVGYSIPNDIDGTEVVERVLIDLGKSFRRLGGKNSVTFVFDLP